MNILEQIRTERHLTQTEMCKIIEIDQRNYTRLINDLNNGKDLKISIGINLASSMRESTLICTLKRNPERVR